MLIKSYIRRVLATVDKRINFIKFLNRSRTTRACISNMNSRKNRREPRSLKLEKVEGRNKDFLFQNQTNSEDLVRCSVICTHVLQVYTAVFPLLSRNVMRSIILGAINALSLLLFDNTLMYRKNIF